MFLGKLTMKQLSDLTNYNGKDILYVYTFREGIIYSIVAFLKYSF